MLQEQNGNLIAAADGVVLDGFDDFQEEIPILDTWKHNSGFQGIVRKHMPHKASVDVEPDLCPGVILIGPVMLVGIGPQNICVPGVDLIGFVVFLDIAPAAEDVLKDIKVVAVDPFDLIIPVYIGNSGHVR